MLRRAGISALWFVMVAFAHEIASSVAGAPRPLGLIVATVVAAYVWLDPGQLLHPTPPSRRRPLVTGIPAETGLAQR